MNSNSNAVGFDIDMDALSAENQPEHIRNAVSNRDVIDGSFGPGAADEMEREAAEGGNPMTDPDGLEGSVASERDAQRASQADSRVPEFPASVAHGFHWFPGEGLKKWHAKAKSWEMVATGVIIPQAIYTISGTDAHVKLKVVSLKGRARYEEIPNSVAQGNQRTLVSELGRLGLAVVDNEAMFSFLKGMIADLSTRQQEMRASRNMGWQLESIEVEGEDGKPKFEDIEGGFLIGSTEYSADGTEKVVPVVGDIEYRRKWMRGRGEADRYTDAVNAAFNKRGMEAAQFTYLCGYASPLVWPFTRERQGLAVVATGDSAAGKSVATMAATTVWGHPDGPGQIRQGRDASTEAAFQKNMGLRGSLPIVMDEMSGWDEREAGAFFYGVSTGTWRDRLGSDGQMQKNDHEHHSNMVLVTTNDDLGKLVALTDRSNQGDAKRYRFFQLNYRKTGAFTESPWIAQALKDNCGHAGEAWARHIVANKDEIVGRLRAVYKELAEELDAPDAARYWLRAMACVIVAGQTTREMGLHDFDMAALRDFACQQYELNRADISDRISSTDDRVAAFMGDLEAHLLITHEMKTAFGGKWKAPGTGHRGGDAPDEIIKEPRGGKTWGRLLTKTNECFVKESAVRDWCRDPKINLDPTRFITELEAGGYINPRVQEGDRLRFKKRGVGQGTIYDLKWERCIEFLKIGEGFGVVQDTGRARQDDMPPVDAYEDADSYEDVAS